MQPIIVLLLVLILVLVVLICFLVFRHRKLNKSIDMLLEKGNMKDLRDVLLEQSGKIEELEKILVEVTARTESLENTSKITIQKTGIVRFNPFGGLGGNQSFSMAILDKQDNGFVISSIFTQEGNRVYAKTIVLGKSNHQLSAEEQEAIERATKINDSKK